MFLVLLYIITAVCKDKIHCNDAHFWLNIMCFIEGHDWDMSMSLSCEYLRKYTLCTTTHGRKMEGTRFL